MTTIKTIFFDLDGTLADTAQDLTNALNQLLKNHSKPTLSIEKIRSIISNGGSALITKGFHIPHDSPEFEPLRKELLDIYRENISLETTLFPGVSELLTELEAQNIKWGIVTNKPGWLTRLLLDALNLSHRSSCIISGDTLHVKKPNPKPLLYACQQTGNKPSESLYIGSTERGIFTGSRALMRTAVALFGGVEDSENPQNWGADRMIKSPSDILLWINTINKITLLRKKQTFI